jgi:hypothetical protein
MVPPARTFSPRGRKIAMPKELHVLGSAVAIVAILLGALTLGEAASSARTTTGQADLQHRVPSGSSPATGE